MPKIITRLISGWDWALNAARRTVNKKPLTNPKVTEKFKLGVLYPEHSPIRTVRYWIDMNAIKRWVSGHIVRHKHGAEHFVGTQRTDRTGINRDKLPQDELTTHCMDVNANEIIFISRRRLCSQSSQDTRYIWKTVLLELQDIDPVLVSICVKECVYRGFCPEMNPCTYNNSQLFKDRRKKYVDRCINNRKA